MHRCRPGDGHRTTSWRPTIDVDVDVERYAIEQEIKRLVEINARRVGDVISLLEEYGGI